MDIPLNTKKYRNRRFKIAANTRKQKKHFTSIVHSLRGSRWYNKDTPNFTNPKDNVKLDQNTIAVCVNTHGSILGNYCINVKVSYPWLEHINKITLGGEYDTCNYISINRTNNFVSHISKLLNIGEIINFKKLCYDTYNLFGYSTPVAQVKHIVSTRSIQKFYIDKNPKTGRTNFNEMSKHGHNMSYVYNKNYDKDGKLIIKFYSGDNKKDEAGLKLLFDGKGSNSLLNVSKNKNIELSNNMYNDDKTQMFFTTEQLIEFLLSKGYYTKILIYDISCNSKPEGNNASLNFNSYCSKYF